MIDRNEEEGKSSEDIQPIGFETAESMIEAARPDFLRKLENDEEAFRRREFTFHFISLELLKEGETLPISIVHAHTEKGFGPIVTKTLSEWRVYWLKAAAARAGLNLDEIK